MICIEIYTKPGCHLCEEAKRVLLSVQKDLPFELHEINIENNAHYYETYKEEIPVVLIDGKKAFKFKVDEDQLRKRLRRIRNENTWFPL